MTSKHSPNLHTLKQYARSSFNHTGSRIMTLVHIVLFEFKPSTESHVIQDVSSRVMAGHVRGDGTSFYIQ